MNAEFQARIAEATRLTQEGRVLEATALIQRALRGDTGPAEAPPRQADTSPGKREPVTLEGVAEPAEAGPRAEPQEPPRASRGTRTDSGPTPRRPRRPRWRKPRLSTLNPVDLGNLDLNLNLDGLKTPGRTPPVPEGARFEWASFSNAAGSRDYRLYVPSGRRDGPLPLLVMLHGCTQNPDDFALGTRMNELAEQHGLLVAYPAQSSGANLNRCWNWFDAAQQCRDQGEPSLIAGITRQVMADHPVDPARVFVAGMSAGGAMAAVMAATYPDLYAAVGIHSGLAFGAARDMPSGFMAMGQGGAPGRGVPDRPIPTIVFHGDRDSTVHPDNAEHIIEQWRTGMEDSGLRWWEDVTEGGGGGVHRHTRTRYHDEDGRDWLEYWRVHGAGHAWAGGDAAGSYTDSRGPDASAEMLRFFLAHGRVGGS